MKRFFLIVCFLNLILFSCTCSKTKVLSENIEDLKIEDISVGTGPEVQKGKKVSLIYTAWLTNGTKVDSSNDPKNPYSFVVGSDEVIKGWDLGIIGMKEGGKRKLTIPPELAYGNEGAEPTIPPFSTLVIEMELLKVE